MFIKRLVLTTLLISSLACSSEPAPDPDPQGDVKNTKESDFNARVIYGKDNRLDLYQVADPMWRNLARSTAALVKSSRMSPRPRSEYDLKTSNFGSDYSLCEEEPFREQGTLAFCSGFFVGGDYMVTAGHCIRTQSDCDNTNFVFGFAVSFDRSTPEKIPSSQVYKCRRVVQTQTGPNGIDFAVVQMDRPITGVDPLRLRRSGTSQPGDELVVIGHPAGLPTKYANGGIVRKIEEGFLVASMDTYGGNSGSAVFNAKTGEVEGILVRGEMDFKWKGQCRVSNVCDQDDCRGEDITRIEYATEFLP